ncbi:MAG: hypothetical protein AAF039_14820 [Bacteroidota bacterium]
MKYQKYLVLAFVAALFLPMLSAKSVEETTNELNLNSVNYIEIEDKTLLDFDTSEYLPEDFDPYQGKFSIRSLNYMEEDNIDLGFDTKEYLPKNFDAYKK